MKKQLIFEECGWMLTEEARSDSRLNPIDLDILAVLQFIKDGKGAYEDGYFNIIIKKGPNIHTSLQGTLADFGLKCDYTTITRSINKLQRMEYIDYKRGWFNNETQKGDYPKIRILRGTVDLGGEMSNTCNSDDCSDTATAQEKDKEKKKEKEKQKEKKKENEKKGAYCKVTSTWRAEELMDALEKDIKGSCFSCLNQLGTRFKFDELSLSAYDRDRELYEANEGYFYGMLEDLLGEGMTPSF